MLLVSLYLYEQTNFRLLYFRFTLFLILPDDGRVSYIQVIVYHLYFLSNKKSICFFRGIVFCELSLLCRHIFYWIASTKFTKRAMFHAPFSLPLFLQYFVMRLIFYASVAHFMAFILNI